MNVDNKKAAEAIGKIHVLVATITISAMVVSVASGQSGSSDEPITRATKHFLTVFHSGTTGTH